MIQRFSRQLLVAAVLFGATGLGMAAADDEIDVKGGFFKKDVEEKKKSPIPELKPEYDKAKVDALRKKYRESLPPIYQSFFGYSDGSGNRPKSRPQKNLSKAQRAELEKRTREVGQDSSKRLSEIRKGSKAGPEWHAHRGDKKVIAVDPKRGVLSLIAGVSDEKEVEKVLGHLSDLHAKKRVAIGEVVIVGLGDWKANFAEHAAKNPLRDPNVKVAKPLHSKIADDYGLASVGTVNSQSVFQRLGVKSSPVWIVRYQGRDHVFEGVKNPLSLFSGDGEFLDPDRGKLAADKGAAPQPPKPQASQASANREREESFLRDKSIPVVRHNQGQMGSKSFPRTTYRDPLFVLEEG